MLRDMVKGIMIVLIAGVAAGCSSTKTVVKDDPGKTTTTVKTIETRFYAEDRAREDQSMDEGNFGYLMGTPQPEDRSQYKKTRKIYVVEVTKNVADAIRVEDVKVDPYVPAKSEPLPPPRKKEPVEPEWAKPVRIPSLMDDEPAADSRTAETSVEEYIVQEGDTLQKISKKYFGSYSKWLGIYEANKDVLKDPNHIKPGMKLQIPLN